MSTALAPYGWDDAWAEQFTPYAAEGLLPGRVVRVDRGQCDVVTTDGVIRADTAFVTPHDPMRVVCTGDWVAVDPAGTPRYVRAYLPRRTAFVRSTSSKRSDGQILAANVDHAVVAVSLAVELDLGRIERFLALAWESGAQPLVVLTKADLVPDPVTLAHLVQDVETSAPGVTVLSASAQDGEGLDVLIALLGSGTSVLLGQSGAGKSTLANALKGEDVMTVQAARDVDGKGRHTTTTRNLLALPGGGVLIDTPGLRGVGLYDAETGVGQVFVGDRGDGRTLPVPRLRP
ncbi:Small ribosomal subunit biogenesis GTPase RsgA OS=Streptomyces glaucescens OX=1907 GN=rsgA PE=3 SV=1 [Streptomyces glaucescens]